MSAEPKSRERNLDPLLQLYVYLNWLIVPCDWRGTKRPLVKAHQASRSPAVLADWWRRWPLALCASRTGKPPQGSGTAIVDVDPRHGGFDTLARLIGPELPPVPQVYSPQGRHFYYLAPANGCFSTVGVGGKRRRGLGLGLDFKCDLAQCHAPGGSPASPYRWDPKFNLETVPLLPLPAALIPIEVGDEEDETPARERRQAIGEPGAYAKAALAKTCDRIRAAVPGVQRHTLNAEAYEIGRLAAGLGLDRQMLVDDLIEAGLGMQQQAGREPWTRYDVRKTVREAFDDGLRKPRVPQIRGRR